MHAVTPKKIPSYCYDVVEEWVGEAYKFGKIYLREIKKKGKRDKYLILIKVMYAFVV